ncbi:hypothetical protein GVAV_001495 [Gurleya vavrai]
MNTDYKYLFKIILIGDSGVGKTCLIKRYTDEIYQQNYISTIGVDFKIKTIQVNNEPVKLQIWDTAGQERFRTITNSYYRGAHGIIVVFDLTDRESFNSVSDWIEEIKAHANENIEIVLIGNKVDLKEKIEVSDKMMEDFVAKSLNNSVFLKTSAKENYCVEEVFVKLASNLVEKEKKNGPLFSKDKEAFNLEENANDDKRFRCC